MVARNFRIALIVDGAPGRIFSNEADFWFKSLGIGASNIWLEESAVTAGYLKKLIFDSIGIGAVDLERDSGLPTHLKRVNWMSLGIKDVHIQANAGGDKLVGTPFETLVLNGITFSVVDSKIQSLPFKAFSLDGINFTVVDGQIQSVPIKAFSLDGVSFSVADAMVASIPFKALSIDGITFQKNISNRIASIPFEALTIKGLDVKSTSGTHIDRIPFVDIQVGTLILAEDTGAWNFGNVPIKNVASYNGKQPFFTDGSQAMTANINANGHTITGLAAAGASGQPTTYEQVNALIDQYGCAPNYQWPVLDAQLYTPPGSPAIGARYLLGLDPSDARCTGAWAGYDGKIAEYTDSGWIFITPTAGYIVTSAAQPEVIYHRGSSIWRPINPALVDEWQASCLDVITDPPGSPSEGQRYLLGLDTSASVCTGAWVGHDGQIAQYIDSQWEFTTPLIGMHCPVDDLPSGLYLFGGTVWSLKEYEATTASGFLSRIGKDIQLKNLVAGKIIIGDATDIPQAKTPGGCLTMSNEGVFTLNDKGVAQGKIDWARTYSNATGNPLAAGTVVKINTDGTLTPPDLGSDLRGSLLGIVEAEILNGASGPVVVVPGKIVGGYSSLIVGQKVYVGASGAVTQDTSGFSAHYELFRIGYAVSATEVRYDQERETVKTDYITEEYEVTEDLGQTLFPLSVANVSKLRRHTIFLNGRRLRLGADKDYTVNWTSREVTTTFTVDKPSVLFIEMFFS